MSCDAAVPTEVPLLWQPDAAGMDRLCASSPVPVMFIPNALPSVVVRIAEIPSAIPVELEAQSLRLCHVEKLSCITAILVARSHRRQMKTAISAGKLQDARGDRRISGAGQRSVIPPIASTDASRPIWNVSARGALKHLFNTQYVSSFSPGGEGESECLSGALDSPPLSPNCQRQRRAMPLKIFRSGLTCSDSSLMPPVLDWRAINGRHPARTGSTALAS